MEPLSTVTLKPKMKKQKQEYGVSLVRDDTFQRLKDATHELPAFPNEEPGTGGKFFKEFVMPEGECFTWHLFETDQVGIHRWFNTAGTIFPEHQHEEDEWIFVYSGELILYCDGIERPVRAGEMVRNEAGFVHGAKFNVNTKYITIMYPPSEDYPHGKRGR
jgi:quercetin dioxygenase-like cupin family protein